MSVDRYPNGRGGDRSLARLGFTDSRTAAARLRELGGAEPDLLTALSRAGDPDRAVLALRRLAEDPAGAAAIPALTADPVLRDRLVRLLGASVTLGDHLCAYPEDWRALAGDRDPSDAPLPADPDHPDPIGALRREYRRRLLALAGRDLAGELSVDTVTAELSDLAGATLRAAYTLARAELPDECRLAVIALGKCGGRELNYVSDVDVIFVAERAGDADERAAARTATRLASTLMRTCARVAWTVDAGLRPEGRNGPLVRTLDSHAAYYRRWARTWEFQALLKATPIAGDPELGRAYLDRIRPLVWAASERDQFVADVRAMRQRVVGGLADQAADRDVKLGPGGLRDVEFAVQLLQLVHGRADESLREAGTLPALAALAAGGYVGRADALALADSYRFLRVVEHRAQLRRLRRTHLIPDDPDELRALARTVLPDAPGDPVAAFTAVRVGHARRVAGLHEKLFYRPLLGTVARVPTEGLRLTPGAAAGRLAALDFADPDGALRHIAALTGGPTRGAAIQRALLPAMLEAFADAPDPDAGLLRYRRLAEALAARSWFPRNVRDEAGLAERLACALGSSRYVADLLDRAPEGLRILGSDTELVPRSVEALTAAFGGAARRHDDPAEAVSVVRSLRRHELLRVACADLFDAIGGPAVGTALSAVMVATLRAALDVASREVTAGVRVAVIAVGRLGGAEIGYGSDADTLFVHQAEPGVEPEAAARAARSVVERMTALLARPGPDPVVRVDTGLRPEGRNGPISRALGSYAEYYRRWSSVWEAQALLRAVPIAGDAELGAAFVELIDPVRYPAGGLNAAQVTEIRRLKARVEAERLPRGADPATHTKLGPGGLADVEWTAQLLALRHAGTDPTLREPGTLATLAAATTAGLLDESDAEILTTAWSTAARVRDATTLVRGRPTDQVPRRGRDLAAVARRFGTPPGGDPGEFLDAYLRTTRRARAVVERVFYE